jgi:hypothetical protein
MVDCFVEPRLSFALYLRLPNLRSIPSYGRFRTVYLLNDALARGIMAGREATEDGALRIVADQVNSNGTAVSFHLAIASIANKAIFEVISSY